MAMNKVAVCVACLLVVYSGICGAVTVNRTGENELTISVELSLAEFSFHKVGGYDYVRGPGVAYLPDVGAPGLPQRPYHVVIPADRRVKSVEASYGSRSVLDGTFDIVPTQPPAVLGESAVGWVTGRPEIYLDDRFYPAQLMGGVHQGFMGDSRLLSFHVSPFSWNPVSGKLAFCEEIEISVELEPSPAVRPTRPHGHGPDRFGEAVLRAVANPEDVERFRGARGAHQLLGASMLEEGDYEYVVITVDSLVASFEPLVQWKIEKGVPATSVTWEWIDLNYSGTDTQDKIRNFIIDAYQTWGTIWILFGGDTGLIPSRRVYAMDAEMGMNGNKIRADLYYSDLDGTWNDNGLAPFGEVADNVDMYPDIFVGRAPANSVADAVVFVNKVLTYEKNPPGDYPLKMLMPGEILWSSPYTDSSIGLNWIDEDFIPPRFDPILKLFESLGNESKESVLAAMSEGQNFVIHDGHCNEYVMGAGDGSIFYTDADTLSNDPKNFILNSIGCWPAAIDRDCIAEHFMNNPGGGCVAFIGNCRYGWGSPGNPGFGYSDKFQYEWARSIFANEVFPLGQSLAEHKAVFVSFAGDENVYRWNEYQVNLLGDPEMPVWTDDPADLYITAPRSVTGSGDDVTVIVEDDEGLIEGALVCLMNDTDVYQAGRTDQAGTITLSISTASPDSLLLTVTAFNHSYHQSRIPVVTEGVLLEVTEVEVLDREDAKPNPGEITDLGITIKNYGTEPDSGVWGVLRATDASCTVLDSMVYYGDMPAGAEATGLSSPRVEFDSTLTNGASVVLEFSLVDSSAGEWSTRVPFVIATSLLSASSYGINDIAGGDGDFVAEPGESMLLTLEISNSGITYDGAQAGLTSLDPYLAVADSVTDAGTIQPGSAGYTLHHVTVDGGCPGTHVGRLLASFSTIRGETFEDTVYFTVGDLTFADDCESGEGSWTYGGLWHLSPYRSHSDSMSWYFGYETTHEYPSSAGGNLVSQDFIAGENNLLSFWFWHDFTTYGVDGVYVISIVNGVPDTLDFIGSGGALEGVDPAPLNIITDWVKWEMTIDDAAPGDTLRFKFGFASDNSDVAEGMYIDDIAFACTVPVQAGIEEPVAETREIALRLHPNPVNADVTISFGGLRDRISVDIFTVDGRFVTRLEKPEGAQAVTWDLHDRSGRKVAPGIYVARTEGRVGTRSSKLVVLR
jgi:hypothetical protein